MFFFPLDPVRKHNLNGTFQNLFMNSNLSGKKIAIFGGNGFIGSHLTSKLCKEACQIHIVTRNPKKKEIFFLQMILDK